jgi:hypothetical protein
MGKLSTGRKGFERIGLAEIQYNGQDVVIN